jgi:anti-sigma B factor antagonist
LLVEVRCGSDISSAQVVLAGELDHPNAAYLLDEVIGVLRDQCPSRIDVDLGGITFLDSSGIRALLLCRADAEQVGCRMVVTNPSRPALEVLEIASLLEHFNVRPEQVGA